VLADGPQTTVIREHRQIAIDAGTEEPSGVRCGPPVNAPGQQAANSVTKPCVRCKDERISLTTVRPFIEPEGRWDSSGATPLALHVHNPKLSTN
jgi:hypothetical protein